MSSSDSSSQNSSTESSYPTDSTSTSESGSSYSSSGDSVSISISDAGIHLGAPKIPLNVVFRNLTYEVDDNSPVSDGGASSGGKKIVLDNVSGEVAPGELLAIMGPTGSGKTSLLSLISGRIKTGITSGDLLVNGHPTSDINKRLIGYVLQNEYMFSELTVRETLEIVAKLKLPRTMSRAEKMEHVDKLLSEVGLLDCQHTKIGNQFSRGVSGGEKKRTSIAQELLTNPSMLILDEPTSGLDSATAMSLLQTLKDLAATGRTVITTLHQPSSKMFQNFDKLMLLDKGRVIYYGRADAVLDYFASIGHECEEHYNPADFLLDVIHEAEDTSKLAEAYAEHAKAEDLIPDKPKPTEVPNETDWQSGFFEQVSILTMRSFKQARGDVFSTLNFSQVIALALVAGLVWWQGELKDSAIQDRIGVLFFSTVFWMFFALFHTLQLFPSERSILAKERASGTYRLSSYFLAKNISEIPIQLFFPLIYAVIVYWMAGLSTRFDAFLVFLVVLLLHVLSGQSVGLLVGAGTMDLKKGLVIAGTGLLAMMLLGGFYVNNNNVPDWLSWVQYLSLIKWTYEALVLNEVESSTFACTASPPIFDSCANNATSVALSDIRDKYGLEDYSTIWGNVGVVLAYTVAMRIGSYILLRTNKMAK